MRTQTIKTGGGDVSEVQMVATILGVIVSFLFGFVVYRNSVKEEGDQNGVMKNKIEHMKEQISFNQEEIKEIKEEISDSKERLTRTEESVKQAHKRITDNQK
nr:hypothetical protein [uncultured Acetobacterium sp.]